MSQVFDERTAARLHDWDGEPVVEPVAAPARGPGEALVAVRAAAVAHIDLTVASGRFAFRPELPYVPGTEGAGHVVASDRLPAGTPVRIRGGGVGLRRDGTWTTHAVVPEDALVAVPPSVDPVLAAGFFSPVVTAHAALHEVGGLEPGERVAVTGAAGAVGALAVRLALEAGAREVVGVERADKLDAVPAGATAAATLADVEPVDLLVDTAGGPELAERVTRGVRAGGRAVLVGYAAGTQATFDLPALLAADVRLLPMNLIRWEARLRGLAAELLPRVGSGELELQRTVFPFARVAEAVRALRTGTATGRVVVTMEED